MTSTSPPAFAPTTPGGRIDTLDVLRGFALIGVCVANVEFFNRPVVQSGQGMQEGLAGLDWAVAWLVNYLVIGKFWTIFSLLFGMGFALMHERAQAAGRPFLPAYLRRIGALLVIGLLHHALLWSGDILTSYAVAATVLMLTLFAPPRVLIAALIACAALPQLPGLELLAWPLVPVVFAAVIGLYLRASARWLLPLLALVPGVLMLLAALVMALTVGGDMATPAISGAVLVLFGLLVWRFGEPAGLRPLRAGLAIVLLAYAMVALDAATRYASDESVAVAAAVDDADDAGDGDGDGDAVADADADEAIDPLEETREREITRSAQETQVLTEDHYRDAIAMRLEHLPQRMQDEVGFSILLAGVFLVGNWFVRSGVIARAADHVPLFRRLALWGIPLGVGLGLLGGLLSSGRSPGVDDPAFELANGLMLLGSVPASLGYIGATVLMLHSRSALARIRLLAPFGRMALTNYLTQSIVFALLFHGYGAGWWGIGRAEQVGIALLLCLLQIGLSHWWMARFQYGPAEWVWRALTYLRWPPLRQGR